MVHIKSILFCMRTTKNTIFKGLFILRKLSISPQSTTGVPMNLRDIMTEQWHKRRNSSKLASFGLDRIVHVAQVLQICCSVGLYCCIGILQELYHFVQIWVSPLHARHCSNTWKMQNITITDTVFAATRKKLDKMVS